MREVFPDLRPASSALWPKVGAQANRIVVARDSQEKDASLSGHGLMSSGVGGRADLMIFDDVVDFRNSVAQPSMRQQVVKCFNEVWINQLGPTGRAFYIATVWHEADLTMHLRGNAEWTVWWRPARDECTGAVLWPGRWDEEALRQREREIGSRLFARQFQLQPMSDAERTFPEEIIGRCRDDRWAPGEVQVPAEWPCFIGVDLASALHQKASYTVIFVAAVDPDTNGRYPKEIIRKRMTFGETVTALIAACERHRPELAYVEANAYQIVLVDHMRETEWGPIVEAFYTGTNKYSADIGIPSLTACLGEGLWSIPSGGEPHRADCDCVWCVWMRELRSYPGSATTDVVMAMWLCDHALREAMDFNRFLDHLEDWNRWR